MAYFGSFYRRLLALVCVGALLQIAGCSEPDPASVAGLVDAKVGTGVLDDTGGGAKLDGKSPDVATPLIDTSPPDSGPPDITQPDNITQPDIAESDAGPDVTEPDASPADCDATPTPDGCPCQAHGACSSGYCLPTMDVDRCAAPCVEECPAGFTCSLVSSLGGGADSILICVQQTVFLCMPCSDDSQCQPAGPPLGATCLDYGDEGSFCSFPCAEGACPGGYACEDGWCVADEAGCACQPLHIALNASTECAVSNQHGSCLGERACDADGLTECDAASPAAEVCDGADNNCSGVADDAAPSVCDVTNQFGSCPGTELCIGGSSVCQGDPATSELCDGLDNDCDGEVDEEFANNDDDPVADCIDDDDDDDGLPDASDNCPITPNTDQLNTDGDAQGNACDADDDGDGSPDTLDCDPLKNWIFPFAPEVCDGLDNDCDGATDEATCDDSDVCTDDVCDFVSGCQHLFNVVVCTDGNKCTADDACSQGECLGSALSCQDGDACTDDSCDPVLGCQHAQNTGPCSDGSACSVGDSCSGGVCVGGLPPLCDDGNICTSDGCDPSQGCVTDPTQGACDDGDPCSVVDTCQQGACFGVAKDCDDGDVCTADACDPGLAQGCTHSPDNGLDCDDGEPCTDPDSCQGGVCDGPATDCDDGFVCTTDVCIDGIGCQHSPDDGQCDDGNACTTGVCDPAQGCVSIAAPCAPTSLSRLHTPSVLLRGAQGSHSISGSAGQASPAGATTSGGGSAFRVIWGFGPGGSP
ncbi:MAG: hypothetical protein ACI9WU_001901 [Myxococcota bacterium]